MEESIESPEDFFNTPEVQILSPAKTRSALRPANVFEVEKQSGPPSKSAADKAVAEAMRKKITCIINNQPFRKTNKAKHESKVVIDSELMAKYKEVNESIKNNAAGVRKTKSALCLRIIGEEKQEKLLSKYRATQGQCKKTLNRSCGAIGRDPNDSVMLRANEFREKVEKARAAKMPYTVKNWYMELRKSEKFDSLRKYTVPVGARMCGLWMNMLDECGRPQDIIRIPCAFSVKSKPTAAAAGMGELTVVWVQRVGCRSQRV